jgi:hypothetical protein
MPMSGCDDDDVSAPSSRLARMIRQSFSSDHADDIIHRLSALEGTSLSAERIQTAMIIRADGNFGRFIAEIELAQLDWRDTLVGTGLEHSDYEEVLDRLLDPAQ